MPRIAVCLFGQPRTWRQTQEKIRALYGEVDYFGSIKTYNTSRLDPTRHQVPKQEVSEIFRTFGTKHQIIEGEPIGFGPYSEMFYSIANSILVKQQWEQAQSFHYDLVCMQRLDILMEDLPLQAPRYNELIFTNTNFSYPQGKTIGVDDLFFYGSNTAINILGASLITMFEARHSMEKANLYSAMPGQIIAEIATRSNLRMIEDRRLKPVIIR